MPVSRVQLLPQSSAELFTELVDHLSSLGATQTGKLWVQCRVYRPLSGSSPNKLLLVLSSSRDPSKVITMVGDKAIVYAQREMETLIGRLKTMYALRNTIRVDLHECVCGDTTVRYGPVSLVTAQSTLSRGLLVETEYRPCAAEAGSAALMADLEQQIIPQRIRDMARDGAEGGAAAAAAAAAASSTDPFLAAIEADMPHEVRAALRYVAAFAANDILVYKATNG